MPFRYEWNAIQVEEKTEQVLQTVTLRDVVPTWNNSLLSITPFILNIGYYKLTFSVTIVTRFELKRTAKTYVRIIKVIAIYLFISCLLVKIMLSYCQGHARKCHAFESNFRGICF
jgi:Ni,Fe-hydrogenase I cytochrome b subunit